MTVPVYQEESSTPGDNGHFTPTGTCSRLRCGAQQLGFVSLFCWILASVLLVVLFTMLWQQGILGFKPNSAMYCSKSTLLKPSSTKETIKGEVQPGKGAVFYEIKAEWVTEKVQYRLAHPKEGVCMHSQIVRTSDTSRDEGSCPRDFAGMCQAASSSLGESNRREDKKILLAGETLLLTILADPSLALSPEDSTDGPHHITHSNGNNNNNKKPIEFELQFMATNEASETEKWKIGAYIALIVFGSGSGVVAVISCLAMFGYYLITTEISHLNVEDGEEVDAGIELSVEDGGRYIPLNAGSANSSGSCAVGETPNGNEEEGGEEEEEGENPLFCICIELYVF